VEKGPKGGPVTAPNPRPKPGARAELSGASEWVSQRSYKIKQYKDLFVGDALAETVFARVK
jgi:hypothetical protein